MFSTSLYPEEKCKHTWPKAELYTFNSKISQLLRDTNAYKSCSLLILGIKESQCLRLEVSYNVLFGI